MKLDEKLFKPDEKFSNHAIQGFSTEQCKINKSCFGIATGFGAAAVNICEYFNKTNVECDYPGNNEK